MIDYVQSEVAPSALGEICRRIADMSEEARSFVDGRQSLAKSLDVLTGHRLHQDAVLLLAHALTEQEAVWWACRCLRDSGEGDAASQAALQAVERWVTDPCEEHRRAGYQAAEAAGFGTAAGCLAFAIWSECDAAPDALPGQQPKGERTAPMVAKAVLMAAVIDGRGEIIQDAEVILGRLARDIQLGIAVADGSDRWPERPLQPQAGTQPQPDQPPRPPVPPVEKRPTPKMLDWD